MRKKKSHSIRKKKKKSHSIRKKKKSHSISKKKKSHPFVVPSPPCVGHVCSGGLQEMKWLFVAVCVFLVLEVLTPEAKTVADPDSKTKVLLPPTTQRDQTRHKRAWEIPAIKFPEHAHGDYPKYLVSVVSDLKKEVRYSLTGPGADQNPKGVFSVNPVTGGIFVTRELDRETFAEYKLDFFAVNMNGIRTESPTKITIQVLDINDHFPQFTQPEFKGFVKEASLPGVTVTAVSAVDQDDPNTAHAIIRYKILWQSPEEPQDEMFTIDSESGIISTLKSGLDREKVSEYNLLVEARDQEGASHGLTRTAKVVIGVTDINDNLPEFFKHEYQGEGRENAVGIVVANLAVMDKDDRHSPAWRAVYKVVQGDPENRFLVKTNPINNEGMVTVVKPLDFEAGEVKIEVQVENEVPLDHGGMQHLSTATVIIKVTDVNESPVFEPSPQRAAVSEDVPVGREVTVMKAHDPDVSLKQHIRYTMWNDPLHWLTIDPLTGVVKTKAPLDREHDHVVASVYEALVIAADTGNPVATGTGTLHLKLDDVNDNTPVMSYKVVSLCQGQLINVSATDADLPPNTSPFIFKLIQQPDLTETWAHQNVSGEYSLLESKGWPDGTYRLSFEISDSGTPALTGNSSMIVNVCWCDAARNCAWRTITIILGIVLSLLLFASFALLISRYTKGRTKANEAFIIPDRKDHPTDKIVQQHDEQGEEEDQTYDPRYLQSPVNEYSMEHKPVMDKQTDVVRRPERFIAEEGLCYPPWFEVHSIDFGDFIDEKLRIADNNPEVLPYDSLLLFRYEGDGSLAASLSSIDFSSSDGCQDDEHLKDLGPRIPNLSDLYCGATECEPLGVSTPPSLGQ